MNIHTFKDAVTSKRRALADEVDEDDEEEVDAAPMRRAVEGEEDEGTEKFNDAGLPLEPFNLRNEREDGYFDENQNFVFKKEVGEADAWIAGLDGAALEAAIGEAAAAEKKKALKREMEEQEEAIKVRKTPEELKLELLSYLEPHETITTALRRLSGKLDNNITTLKGKRTKPTALHEEDKQTINNRSKLIKPSEIARMNRPKIDRIIEIADELIASGLTGVYGMSKEAIYASTILWEYKGGDGLIYGPYTSQQISEWKAQGYFTGSTAVMMRQVHRTLLLPATTQVNPKKRSKITSIYDDDEEVEEVEKEANAKKAKIESSQASANAISSSITSPQKQQQVAVEEVVWIHSDEIDFGEFVNLESENVNVVGDGMDMEEEEEENGKGKRGRGRGVQSDGYASD